MNERDGAPVVAPAAAQKEFGQAQPERLTVREPPVDRLALGVDAIASTELDQPRLPKGTLLVEILYRSMRIKGVKRDECQ